MSEEPKRPTVTDHGGYISVDPVEAVEYNRETIEEIYKLVTRPSITEEKIEDATEAILRWFVQIDDPLRDWHHALEMRRILRNLIGEVK